MKTALILNFTGNGYHFGCFGTAREIHTQLQEKGYLVNYLTVKISHGTLVIPGKLSDFSSRDFVNNYIRHNNAIYSSIIESDIVVVNGEGTLHRTGRGPIHLLFMMHLAKVVLGRPTYLINHSCFPALDGKDASKMYAKVIQSLDGVVPRENYTKRMYDAMSIDSVQGFDSLPLYIDRVGLNAYRKENASLIQENKTVLICGGINYEKAAIRSLALNLNKLDKSYRFKFLLGGKQDLAKDEVPIFEAFRNTGLVIDLVQATSFQEWAETIGSSLFLVSGRFHYTIAALALGTPVVSYPSNTPKIQAIHELLEHPGSFSWEQACDDQEVKNMIERLGDGRFDVSERTQLKIRELALNNFSVIPDA